MLTKNFKEIDTGIGRLNSSISELEESMILGDYEKVQEGARLIAEGVLKEKYNLSGTLYEMISLYNNIYGNQVISDALHTIRKYGNKMHHYSSGASESISFTNALYIMKSVSFLLQEAYQERNIEDFYFTEIPYLPRDKAIEATVAKKQTDIIINSKELQISKTNLISWFKNKQMIFTIPFYQRSYTWDIETLSTLVEDLKLRIKDRNQHYFGVVATKRELENDDRVNRKIIDGQQRITTSLLFFRAAYDSLKQREMKNINILEEIFATEINKRYVNTSEREQVFKEFSDIMSGKFIWSNTCYSYGRNYQWFLDMFNGLEWNELYEYVSVYASKFEIAELKYEIETKREMDIFENMNSKGTELAEFELIRNQIFNSISYDAMTDQKKVSLMNEYFLNNFRSGFSKLDAKKLNIILSEFFNEIIFYKFSQGGGHKEWQTFKRFPIYNNFKIAFSDLYLENEDEYIDFLDFLNSQAVIYKGLKLKNATSISDDLSGLSTKLNNISSRQQTLATIMSLINKYCDWDSGSLDYGRKWNVNNKEQINGVISLLDTCIARNSVVNGTGTSLRKPFMDIAKMISNRMDMKQIKNFIVNNETLYISDESFIANLSTKIKTTTAQPLFTQLEQYLIDRGRDSGLSFDVKKPSIEHVMPQSNINWQDFLKGQTRTWESKYKETLDLIGNFYTLPQKLNSKLSNSFFDTKKYKLANYKTPLMDGDEELGLEKLSNISAWTYSYIEKRTKTLAKIFAKNIYKY